MKPQLSQTDIQNRLIAYTMLSESIKRQKALPLNNCYRNYILWSVQDVLKERCKKNEILSDAVLDFFKNELMKVKEEQIEGAFMVDEDEFLLTHRVIKLLRQSLEKESVHATVSI